MKTIAVFMAACILFLSAFSGIAIIPMKENCCPRMMHQDACGHDKNGTKDCCNKGMCGMMLSCSSCGFLIVHPFSLSPVINYNEERLVAPYVIGNLSGYPHSGWHPPQI
jgi:hypothetical protein